MRAIKSSGSLILLVILCVSCGNRDADCLKVGGAPSFSVEDARKALISLLTVRDDTVLGSAILRSAIPFLQSEKAVVGEDGNAQIGVFRIDLKKRHFHFEVITSVSLTGYSGHFDKVDGEWVAVLDNQMHADSLLTAPVE